MNDTTATPRMTEFRCSQRGFDPELALDLLQIPIELLTFGVDVSFYSVCCFAHCGFSFTVVMPGDGHRNDEQGGRR